MSDPRITARGRNKSSRKHGLNTDQASSMLSTTTETSDSSIKKPVLPSKNMLEEEPKKTFTALPAAVIPIITLNGRGSATKPIPPVIFKLRETLSSGLEPAYIPDLCKIEIIAPPMNKYLWIQHYLSVIDPIEYSTITPEVYRPNLPSDSEMWKLVKDVEYEAQACANHYKD